MAGHLLLSLERIQMRGIRAFEPVHLALSVSRFIPQFLTRRQELTVVKLQLCLG
jgi:hypothetical protein